MSLGHGNCLESGIAWSWVILLEISAAKSMLRNLGMKYMAMVSLGYPKKRKSRE